MRHQLAKYIPKKLGYLPYNIALSLLSALSALPIWKSRFQIWPRNSFALGTLVPLVSDLDLTVWFEETPLRSNILQLRRNLNAFKLLFPMLGEVNLYVKEEVISFINCANFYELNRDPSLYARFSNQGSRDHFGDASVLLFRCLESDISNLYHHPQLRQNKWHDHFIRTKQTTHVDLSDDPILQIIKISIPEASLEECYDLKFYFLETMKGRPLNEIPMTRSRWIYLPHKSCFDLSDIPQMTLNESRFFLNQIRWEVFGLMSQYRLSNNLNEILSHLERLTFALSHAQRMNSQFITLTDSQELCKDLNDLAEKIRDYLK